MVKLSKRKLRRTGKWLVRLGLGSLAFLVMSWGLYTIGIRVTPPGSPPVIYSPSVQRTETYRRRAETWLAELQALDTEVVTLISYPPPDLYTLAQRAQTLLEAAAQVSQAISLLYPPAGLTRVRDDLQVTADLYLEATAALTQWVGEPTETRYLVILEAMRVARSARATLEANPWLASPVPAQPTSLLPASPSRNGAPGEAMPPAGTPHWGE